ncbi:MAG: hypothetical protein JRE40_01705 [Deltaproteobacteria bacterium]|nr:hypothetical protein [Deltaproteobacteria bacterium]MBW2672514.1 hypothetical protein [Deltaproteobacteria bacterium]
MPDYPDYTEGVSIDAVTVETLPIDVVAQTIGNIAVNIAASTVTLDVKTAPGEKVEVGIVSSVQLDVNIAASAITLNVHETGTANVSVVSAVQLDVNIAASAITLNVKTAAGEKVEVGIVSSIALDINITGSAINVPMEIKAPLDAAGNVNVGIASSITLNMNITGSAISVPVTTTAGEHVDVDITSSITLDMNITGSAISVPVTNPAGESLDVDIVSSITVNMNITGSTITVPIETLPGQHVDVDVVSSITLNMNITGSDVTLAVDITAQSVGNLAIDIAAQSVGNVAVNIAASAVTLDVNIAAQAVDINIKTSGGANIVIDKLTQTAYTERRSTISNNGATATMESAGTTTYRGKFFPRGMRGFLGSIEIYCDNSDTADHTFTIKIAPQPSMGPTIEETLTVSAGASAAWASRIIREFWNYDSMFIWVVADNATYPRIGYDTDTPYDAHHSTDETTWIPQNRRYWIRILMRGETVGDVPVSGTLNTIRIPSESQERLYVSNTNLSTTETTMKEIHGAGNVEYIEAWVSAKTNSHFTRLRVYCDDNLAFYWDFNSLNDIGYTASTPGISLLKFATDGFCSVHLTLNFNFKRKLKITMQAAITSGQNVTVEGLVNLIK